MVRVVMEKRYVSSISGMLDNRERIKKEAEKKSTKNIRKYCREYCEYTGIHGLRYFGEKRSIFEKVCWLIVFITSLLVCIAVIYQTYKKWQCQPIMVNFSSEDKNINEIAFPAVTICQEIKISRSYFNYSRVLREFIDKKELESTDLKKLQYMSLLCAEDKIYKKDIPNVTNIDEDFYEFLLKGSKPFLFSCTWMGTKFDCNDIFRPIITDEGLCYTFNMLENEDIFTNISYIANLKHKKSPNYSSKVTNWTVDSGYSPNAQVHTYPRRALLPGYTNALKINMKIDVSDVDYACTSFQGYQVVLHQAIRYPLAQIHYFRVPLKKAVIVAISPRQLMNSEDVNGYTVDKRDCFLQGEKKLKFFRNYTQNNCELECVSNLTLANCGCAAFYMPRSKTSPICGNEKINCIKEVKKRLNTRKLELLIEGDGKQYNECKCLQMCSYVDYDTEITEIEYDRRKEYESMGFQPDDNGHHAWSQLVIYFKSSYFIPHVRTELYGHLDFLANVGGLLGLFIGFSLLSLFEIIYFVSIRIICNLKIYKRWYGSHTQ